MQDILEWTSRSNTNTSIETGACKLATKMASIPFIGIQSRDFLKHLSSLNVKFVKL